MARLVYDTKLKRPACVLLQAAYNCDHSSREFELFDAQDWLIYPTKDMAIFEGDYKLWQAVAKITIENRLATLLPGEG